MSWLPAPFKRCHRYIAGKSSSLITARSTAMTDEMHVSQELPSITMMTPTPTETGPQFTYGDDNARQLSVPQIVLFRRHSEDLRLRTK